MANNKFIKVTPKGEKEPRIVLATLKSFYLSHGAKIETPTDEEIYQAEPSERPRTTASETASRASVYAEQKSEIKELRHAIDTLDQDNKAKQETIAQQAAEIAELREKLAASEAALTETENALEAARKDLYKNKKATAE